MRSLLAVATVALLLASCGGGGGGGTVETTTTAPTTTTTTTTTPATSTSETTETQETRTALLEGQIVPSTKAFSVDGVEIAYAVITTLDNGTAESFAAQVSDSGTFTVQIPAGRNYVLSFFSSNGTPVASTLSEELAVEPEAERVRLEIQLADLNGDGIPDEALMRPEEGAQVKERHFEDRDGDHLPDEVEELFDHDLNGIPDAIQEWVQEHLQQLEQVENQEQMEEQMEEQVEEQVENQEQVEERVRELVENRTFQNYLTSFPRALGAVHELWDLGVGEVIWQIYNHIPEGTTKSFSCFNGGSAISTNLGNNTYQIQFSNCNFQTGLTEVNGILRIHVDNPASDRIKVEVIDGEFSFRTADHLTEFRFSEGTTAEFEDNGSLIIQESLYPARSYDGQIKLLGFRGDVSVVNVIARRVYSYQSLEVSGEYRNFCRYSIQDANLKGKVVFKSWDFPEESYQFETKDLTSTYFSEPLNTDSFIPRAVITGTALFDAGDYQLEVEYNATDPQVIHDDEVEVRMNGEVLAVFGGER